MKKLMIPFVLGIIAFFGLDACLTSDEGSNFTLEWNEPVTQLNQSTRVITTRQVDYYCENGSAQGDTSLNTQDYDVTGGKLYLWDPGTCAAEVYSGASSTIVGSWTLDGITRVAIPAALRPSYCSSTVSSEDTSGLGAVNEYIQNVTASADISATNVHLKISGTFCFGTLLAKVFTEEGSSSVQVLSSSCTTVQIKSLETNQTATFSAGFSNNSINLTFKSGTKTCTNSEPFPAPNTVPVCPAANSSSSDDAYEACLESTPFAGTAKVAAKSAWSSDIKDAIRNSVRTPHF